MDEHIQDEIRKIISEIEEKSASGNHIYRGEPEDYGKVSSNLWRDYRIEEGDFDIEVVQMELLSGAKKHIRDIPQDYRKDLAASQNMTEEESDKIIDFEILTEIQHYGGKTNLIDFTTDYFIALFFACDGHHNKKGRVILQKTEEIQDIIEYPRNPRHRVIAQKSIFVCPPKGFIEPHEDNVVIIPGDLKQWVLQHLRQYYRISKETIYNDVHGFIRHQDIHGEAYTEFYKGFVWQKRGAEATSSEAKQKAYETSIKHYTQTIKWEPNLAEAYNNRGSTYSEKGDYGRAIEDFDHAIELDSNYADAYSNRGTAYRAQENFDRAFADYGKALELNPSLASTYYNRGGSYYNKGEVDLAIADYTKAIELNPNHADAYYNRGIIYNNKGEVDLAIADFDRLIEINPNDASAYNNRGSSYNNKGNYDCAIKDFNRAIELNPNHADAYNSRGIAYRQIGKITLAIADFDRLIEINPNDASAYNNRGVAYGLQGTHDHAIKDFNRAIELNPNHADAYNGRGIAYRQIGKLTRAIADFDRSIELNPNEASAYNNRAAAQRENWKT